MKEGRREAWSPEWTYTRVPGLRAVEILDGDGRMTPPCAAGEAEAVQTSLGGPVPQAAPAFQAPGEQFWTAHRRELRGWFTRNASSLGELYEGALVILWGATQPVPGWSRFVAHAVREIMNGLPRAVVGTRTGGARLDHTHRLQVIEVEWEKAGLPLDGSFPGGEGEIPDLPVTSVSIPRTAYQPVAELIRDHREVRERPREAAMRLFEAIVPEARRESMVPIGVQWDRVRRWFVERTHDGLRADATHDFGEYREQFERFERILMGLVRDFFKTTDELDEVLGEANR